MLALTAAVLRLASGQRQQLAVIKQPMSELDSFVVAVGKDRKHLFAVDYCPWMLDYGYFAFVVSFHYSLLFLYNC